MRYLPKPDRLIMGFREHHSNRLTSIHSCSVLDKTYQIVCLSYALYPKSKRQSAHWSCRISKGDNEISLLVRHVEKLNNSDVNQLKQFALHKGWQLYLQPKGPESIRRIDDEQGAFTFTLCLRKV